MNYLERLSMMLVLLGIFFVISVQPMFMMSTLIFIIILYSIIMYNKLMGYWFSYLLMMVMLSGVMVLFTYMVSLVPNEWFEGYNMMYMLLVMLMVMFMTDMMLYNNGHFYMSLFLWMSSLSIFTISLVIFLLMMMLMVVWLSYMSEGSLRIY